MPKKTKSWFTLSNQGDIGSYDIEAMDLIKALQSVGTQDAEFRIQSYGGSVYEGLAMYNAIKAHKGKTIGVVDGLVASISSYFLMACDEIQMPENAKLMIHDPSIGAWGGENEIQSALTQLKNAKQTIADAYAERCGKSLEDVLQAMEKETWFTASQALEFGLIDTVIDAVDLSNSLKSVSAADLQAKAFKHMPDDLLNQLVYPPATTTPEPLIIQQSDPMPKPIDNDALQNALKNENQRQSIIRALCATHKVSDTLRDEMLNDLECSAEDCSLKILQYLGSISIHGQEPNEEQTPTTLINTHIHVGNGNTIKDALQNALDARCGTEEIEKDNPYRLKTLLDMAEITIGKDVKYCSNKNDLVARAFNSGDFADIITESVRTVMRDEAQVRAPLWRELANTENLPNFKETDLILINDAPDLMAVSEDGEYKAATIKGSGEKIQLASFGREIAFTRQAIINDEIALISKIPRKFMQSAYRLSDKLMFNAILSGKMGDGESVFTLGGSNKWGNFVKDIPGADYQALIMALHKAFATATTSEGDALDLRGEILLANPDHASFLEAVLNTASKPDSFNPAYKKFPKVIETARLADINGAIALTGKTFDSVVMGFLDGTQDPWLETGDGWSSDGAKFRITYDVTSKVLDRRGIAQAIFTAKK
ncbi:ClpP-like prohead protease/major capsid protein fusion protein [Photobacterium leiognathi subsp. mandapamensis]